jgi:Ca2+-binding RTX toxin-like protein
MGSLKLSQAVSTLLSKGDNDTIIASDGTKHIIGGYGQDNITTGAGNHVIIGDAGQIDYDTDGAAKVMSTSDTEVNSAYGAADVIWAGNGDNIILGGMGADTITTATGTDVILGDNGIVTYAGATGSLKLSQIVSMVTSRGGNDVITTGDGTKHIVGGFGADTITAGAGNHNVIGDNGQIDYDTDGTRKILATTDTEANSAYGDADTITITGDGSNIILGGMGADTIKSEATTAGTTDIILGDNGTVTYAGTTGSLKLSQIVSTVTSRGGNDVITTGDGTKHIVGGYGQDAITAGAGNHVIIGDAGQIDYDTDGTAKIIATTDTDTHPEYGAADTITAGNGNNIILGGMGADTITTATGTDVILGDNGIVTYAGATGSLKLHQIISTVLSRGGNDTITTGNGNKQIVGGYGADTVTSGAGDHVVVGDAGQLDYDAHGVVKTLQTTDTVDHPEYGGDDRITITGDGNNNIIGGMGSDEIRTAFTTAGTTDVILGDNGTVSYEADGSGTLKLHQIVSTVLSQGSDYGIVSGNDIIETGAGTKFILGGYGADAITAGAGNHVIIGDAGRIDYDTDGAVKVVQTTDTVDHPEYGAADTITAGNGNNIILGGMGADTITTATGTDVILGDNGIVTYTGATGSLQLSQAVTTLPSRGDNETINTGDGTKHIIGGYGQDAITAGAGNHVIIGDAGQIDYDTDGAAKVVQTTDTVDHPEYGDADTITAGNGNNIILGGMGADTITTSTGTDVILGDNGIVTYAGATGSLQLNQISSTLPSFGDDDTIMTGNGDKHVIAGYGNDNVSTGSGNDIVIGDNGTIEYENGIPKLIYSTYPTIGGDDFITTDGGSDIVIAGAGQDTVYTGDGKDVLIGDTGKVTLQTGAWHWIETTDVGVGGDDFLDGGSGEDIMLGGAGRNVFVGSLSEDIMVGTYGRVTIGNGRIASVVRLDSIDIISNTNTSVIEHSTNNSEEDSRGMLSGRSQFSNFFAFEDAGGWFAAGFQWTQQSEFNEFFEAQQGEFHELFISDEYFLSDSSGSAYAAQSSDTSRALFDGLRPEAPQPDPGIAGGLISVSVKGDYPGSADKDLNSGDVSQPRYIRDADSGQQPMVQQENAQSGSHRSEILTAEISEDNTKADSGLGVAVAGMTGWRVLSGKDLDKNRVIDLDSFRKLAEKQERRRFKKWKNAGTG